MAEKGVLPCGTGALVMVIYFVLFECVATTLKWLRSIWSLLLQCVFTGKAQDAYASLSPESGLRGS